MSPRHPHSTFARAAAFAAGVILLSSGFGCKPVLDARVQQTQTKPSPWVVEEPVFDFKPQPDVPGELTMTMKSKPDTIVSVSLDGPGILSDKTMVKPVGTDGAVRFRWETNRTGRYTYKVTISFNNIIVESFDDQFDTDEFGIR